MPSPVLSRVTTRREESFDAPNPPLPPHLSSVDPPPSLKTNKQLVKTDDGGSVHRDPGPGPGWSRGDSAVAADLRWRVRRSWRRPSLGVPVGEPAHEGLCGKCRVLFVRSIYTLLVLSMSALLSSFVFLFSFLWVVRLICWSVLLFYSGRRGGGVDWVCFSLLFFFPLFVLMSVCFGFFRPRRRTRF